MDFDTATFILALIGIITTIFSAENISIRKQWSVEDDERADILIGALTYVIHHPEKSAEEIWGSESIHKAQRIYQRFEKSPHIMSRKLRNARRAYSLVEDSIKVRHRRDSIQGSTKEAELKVFTKAAKFYQHTLKHGIPVSTWKFYNLEVNQF